MGLNIGLFQQSQIEEDDSEEPSAEPLVKVHLQDKQEELQAKKKKKRWIVYGTPQQLTTSTCWLCP